MSEHDDELALFPPTAPALAERALRSRVPSRTAWRLVRLAQEHEIDVSRWSEALLDAAAGIQTVWERELVIVAACAVRPELNLPAAVATAEVRLLERMLRLPDDDGGSGSVLN
jgi:hypothetical protein